MSYGGAKYESVYSWGYYAAIGLAIALIAIFQPFVKAPPPNSRAYGCYVADGAPSIRLDQTGMNILQRGFPQIPYHLERHKTAITLTADAPIQADLSGSRYVYSIYHPGEGWYLDFRRIVNGHVYGEFVETHLTMFQMLAQNGAEITYNKASPARC